MHHQVRLSLLIALPTDMEVSAIGAADAGEYLLELRSSPDELAEFVERRKRSWWQEPTQQAGRCVEHLI